MCYLLFKISRAVPNLPSSIICFSECSHAYLINTHHNQAARTLSVTLVHPRGATQMSPLSWILLPKLLSRISKSCFLANNYSYLNPDSKCHCSRSKREEDRRITKELSQHQGKPFGRGRAETHRADSKERAGWAARQPGVTAATKQAKWMVSTTKFATQSRQPTSLKQVPTNSLFHQVPLLDSS